jgi:hypothetical protein
LGQTETELFLLMGMDRKFTDLPVGLITYSTTVGICLV